MQSWELGVLGPLRARYAGTTIPITAPKQRVLLAALAIAGHEAVSVDRLLALLWGERPPASAHNTVKNYALRLRRTLAGASGTSPILTTTSGYRLGTPAQAVDLFRFVGLEKRARAEATSGALDSAAALLEQALQLWRGAPLADVPSELLHQEVSAGLIERHLSVVELGFEVALRRGRHDDVVTDLTALSQQHPLREQLAALAMLALYRCGRASTALTLYQNTAAVLRDELGVDAGPALQALHQQILRQEPTLHAGDNTIPIADRPRPIPLPAQLPAAVPSFVGRERELAELDTMLAGPASVAVLAGTAGVGKTALALHWGHRVKERFPDGQLYVDLRGYAPRGQVSASEALAGFLRELGVDSTAVPVEVTERAARFRSLLAGRRVLVVLDNAESVDQVRPLLPGTQSCFTLVTSRTELVGLVAREGARRVRLDLMTAAESRALLRDVMGERADSEPAAAAQIVLLCARLPLALRVAADRVRTEPAALATLAAGLADERRRLDLLEAGGDADTAVRAVFSWSFQRLDPAAAGLFRLMSLHPGRDSDVYALAALADTDIQSVHPLLDALVGAHLVAKSAGRYALHDLLRAYGAEQAALHDAAVGRRAAIERLYAYYRYAASVAARLMVPDESFLRPEVAPVGYEIPPLPDATAALAWLDRERATLMQVASSAAAADVERVVADLSGILHRYLDDGVHIDESSALHGMALKVAVAAEDRETQARAQHFLGVVHSRRGDPEAALRCLLQAYELSDAMRPESRLYLLSDLGQACDWLGQYSRAVDYLTQARTGYDLLDGRMPQEVVDAGRARVLSLLGEVNTTCGQYPEAMAVLAEALSVHTRLDDVRAEAMTRISLGYAMERAGDLDLAVEQLELAREIGEQTSSHDVQLELSTLGTVYWKLGRRTEAHACLADCLQLARNAGATPTVAEVLNTMGDLATLEDRLDDAMGHHREALELAITTGYRYEQAHAEEGMAEANDRLGHPARVTAHRRCGRTP